MTLLVPDWPAPPGVVAFVTTREVGNLARHVGSADDAVANRRQLAQAQNLPAEPFWMEQLHGNRVVTPEAEKGLPRADAAYTRLAGRPLAVMVADCLPILLASRDGNEIGAVHAGWRGLACGVVREALSRFHSRDIVAWLGPAIGPCHYEVDEVVRRAFSTDTGFRVGKDARHWMMDLYAVATAQLEAEGVDSVWGGGLCTYCDARFYSHRRDGERDGGRMAAVIWRGV